MIKSFGVYEEQGGQKEVATAGGIHTGTTAVTALRVMYESGNIASGVFKLLRIARS